MMTPINPAANFQNVLLEFPIRLSNNHDFSISHLLPIDTGYFGAQMKLNFSKPSAKSHPEQFLIELRNAGIKPFVNKFFIFFRISEKAGKERMADDGRKLLLSDIIAKT